MKTIQSMTIYLTETSKQMMLVAVSPCINDVYIGPEIL